MNEMKVYDTMECMKLIKKIYPWIPIFIIRRVLYAEEVYMHKIGIISWKPVLESWIFTKKTTKNLISFSKRESPNKGSFFLYFSNGGIQMRW